MTVVPYSTKMIPTLGQIRNVDININTLVSGQVISFDATTQLWKNTGGGAVNAQTIDITDVNTSADYNLVFCDGAGVNKQLSVDATIGPISVNPSTGDLNIVDTLVVNTTQVRCGKRAGASNQGSGAVAVGLLAGFETQAKEAVAIGIQAGEELQLGAVAVGAFSGQREQGDQAIAIGADAGNSRQGKGAIAIGGAAGQTTQGGGAISIGQNAGNFTQGKSSIAIGTNSASSLQPNNQILINATGLPVNGLFASACYITPIRGLPHGLGVGVIKYDPISFELTYSTT